MVSAAEASQDLVGTIERRIHSKTHGRVRDLRVELADRAIVLYGRASTYYLKQLALHGALDALAGCRVINQIEVG
jgi:hypothetical protein